MDKKTKFAKLSAIGIYLLIAFEFFYMASPFAIYMYAVYQPGLDFLGNFPSVAWLTGFFMPHLVVDTKSVILNNITGVGIIIAAAGFSAFVVCAAQIYYSKLFNNKAVISGIYKYIRHPQYTAFALCSFGVLLVWPRYLSLFSFVIMLFLYYWLARIEERECDEKFGEDYRIYKRKTAMFFPIPKALKAPGSGIIIFMKRVPKPVLFIGLCLLAFAFAIKIRQVSVAQLYSYTTSDGAWMSIYQADTAMMHELSTTLRANEQIGELIDKKADNRAQLIYYVMPEEMYISEIPMLKPDSATCHVRSADYEQGNYKVVITEGVHSSEGCSLSGQNLILSTRFLKPIAELSIGADRKSIENIIDLPQSDRYKNVPEPVF